MLWLRVTLVWMLLWQALIPAGVLASRVVVHDPSRCRCANVGSGCCGEAVACPGSTAASCCGGGEVCGCGCMVPVHREPEEQTPRMVVRGDVMVAPVAERRVVLVDVGEVRAGWSVRGVERDMLYAGVRRHTGVCIWQE